MHDNKYIWHRCVDKNTSGLRNNRGLRHAAPINVQRNVSRRTRQLESFASRPRYRSAKSSGKLSLSFSVLPETGKSGGNGGRERTCRENFEMDATRSRNLGKFYLTQYRAHTQRAVKKLPFITRN